MTAPFSFPTINPGQPIMQEGMGDTISSGIAGVLKAMQDKQKLEQEKQEFQSKQQYFKTLDEGNELDNQQKRDKMKQEQKGLEAKGIANDAFAQWAGSGGDFTKVGQIIASGRFKNNPDAAQTFIATVHDHLSNLQQAAQAQKAQSDAAVATATQGDQIAQSGAEAQKAQADATVATGTETEQVRDAKATRQLHEAQAQKAIADANPTAGGPDAGLANAAANLGRTFGLPLGQAYQAVGGTLPAGIDPAATAQVGSGTGAADKRRNQVTSEAAKASDALINDMTTRGVRIKKLTPLVAGTKLGEMMLGPDEQQLLQANRQFAQMYGLFVTGQASSEPELQRILKTVVPSAGDKDPVLQQKALMRQVILQAMQSAYGQGKPASEALTNAAQQAMDMGIKMDGISLLQKSAMDARNKETQAAQDSTKAPVFAPATQWTQQDYDSLMNNRDWSRSR